MSCILHIETSTSACSVAVSEDGQNVFKKEDLNGPSHAVSLGVFVDEALSFADSHAMPLDAVAVSCGPGSYTGLRIGVPYEHDTVDRQELLQSWNHGGHCSISAGTSPGPGTAG